MRLVKKYQTGNTIEPNNQRVKEFFEYDVIPRYKQLHPNATQEEIDKLKSVYTKPAYTKYFGLDTSTGGVFDPDTQNVYFNELFKNIPANTIAHEYGHYFDYLKGILPEERKMVNEAIHTNGIDDLDVEDLENLNALRLGRWTIWNKIYDLNNRIPELSETDQAINNKSKSGVSKLFQNLNGYDIQVYDANKAKEGMIKYAHHYVPKSDIEMMA